MQVFAIKTDILLPPERDLIGLIKRANPPLLEGDILVIASKVVAIAEGRIVKKDEVSKDELVRSESERYIEKEATPGKVVMHAIVNGQLAVFAGIDPFGEWYALWPEDPMKSAESICEALKAEYDLKKLGVIISDSKSTPLRRGVIGGAISFAGFNPLFDNRKRTDLTGWPSGGSQINVADAIAAAAVLVMGEGTEQTPLVIVRDAPYAHMDNVPTQENGTSYVVPLKEDIFAPFFDRDIWQKGGRKEN
jgi:dihydrofolate synthase / folylpolyglutamate synthase